MNENKKEVTESLDKIISTTNDIKRRVRLLNDKDCSVAFHQKSHEAIDDRLTKIKKDLDFFIKANSIINKLLEATDIKAKDFFKKDNARKRKKPAHDRAKEHIVDARTLFSLLFQDQYDDVISRYLNVSRSMVITYKTRGADLLKNDKKFKEYYDNTIKKLNLDPV